jgi:uncharacterized protein (TIGR03437 family)
MYAFGRFVYRSEDAGRHWENVSGYKGLSLIGNGLKDLAVAPRRPDELTVAGDAGVFRSLDKGRSWHGLNESLPNLPAARILSTPAGGHGPQIEAAGRVLEWTPGQLQAWDRAQNQDFSDERILRRTLSGRYGVEITALARSSINGFVYLGDGNGNIRALFTGGELLFEVRGEGRVTGFWVDSRDPRYALAIYSSGAVMHTINGGSFWVPVKGNLPSGSANAITADSASNTVYVATNAGVFYTQFALDTLSGIPAWTQIPGLPAARVTGVGLDAEKTQVWVALEGFGVFRTLAPHRLLDPKVVIAADRRVRAVAPGTVVSVVGVANVKSATADGIDAPVLNAGEVESQIQIPYSVKGTSVSLAVTGQSGNRREFRGLDLRPAAPAIFEIDGTPLLEDADRGEPLDSMNPGRSHMRVRIIAQGLGMVRDAGTTDFDDRDVIEPVIAFLNGGTIEVARAILAPGYVGVYWVDVDLPLITQYGMADLYIQVGGQESNHVRFFVESGLY